MTNDGLEKVTSVRILGDDRENKRRVNEEQARRERQERLDLEAESSTRRMAAVSMKWAALGDSDVPQQLLEEINLQKEACDRIVAAKDALIEEFNEELRRKDGEYVKALRKQAQDVTQLLAYMKEQTTALQRTYTEELQNIERAFVQERAELVEANRTEVETALERRRGMEMQFMALKQKRIVEERKELEETRVKNAEVYNILKNKLETEIQGMEQQLEEMRAAYQLNQEKLDYNWKVLHEREEENKATIAQQEKKLDRLLAALSALIQKYDKTDKQYRQENAELTEEYRRITTSFKDLQSKFRHFEISDGKRYRELWAMNEKTVSELVQKVLQADKVITEQQLGWSWVPPSDEYFSNPEGGAGRGPEDAARAEEERSRREEELRQQQRAREQSSFSNETINAVLTLISDEAGFLIEDRVRAVLEPLDPDERSVVKIDAVLKVLGVESAADVEELVRYFLRPVPRDPAAAAAGDGSPGGAASEVTLVETTEAIAALKSFITDHQTKLAEVSKNLKASVKLSADDEVKRAEREEQAFWKRMADVLPEKHWRVWVNLEKEMARYNTVLQERAAVIEETEGLHRQNEELRALLSQYLSADVNKDLIFAPMSLMRIGN